MLGLFGGWLSPWQLILVIVLVALIIFWKKYRSKNM